MSDVLISVVVPVYNRSKIISNTLNSLLKQTFNNFEVIIVDDCSKDSEDLLRVIKKYNDKLDIRYYRHETNRHGAAARNTGIINSRGKYIALLDSDDLWLPTKLQRSLEELSDFNTILYSKVSDRGVVSPKLAIAVNESVDEYLIVNSGTMQTSSIFLYSEFCKKILFDETLKRFQDYDFVIRAQKEHGANFKFIDDVLVDMSDDDHGGRISNSLDHRPGLFWIEKKLLSRKAESVFVFNRLVNYCICSGKKRDAFKMLVDYGCLRYFYLWDYKVVAKLLLPNFVLNYLLKRN